MSDSIGTRRILAVGTFALLGLGLLPASASALTIDRSAANAATITVTASPGEVNNFDVTRGGAFPNSTYIFTEAAASSFSLTGAAGCTASDSTPPTITVTCLDTVGTTSTDAVITNLGDGNDDFNASTIAGAAVAGGADPFTINGGDGNDVIVAAARTAASDTMNGGSGMDRLTGLGGLDLYNGGADIDRAVLNTGATAGATVTLDGVLNDSDGAGGTGTDNIGSDVESITGTAFADTITGSCSANTVAGDAGTADGSAGAADTINGDPAGCAPNGGDFLGGGEGSDSFNCDGTGATPGFDTVTYGIPYTGGAAISVTLDDVANDNDGMGNAAENVQGDCERIIGTANADTINAAAADQGVQLFGRLGNDTLTGSGFNDLLNGEDGTDVGNCGGGTDTAISIETPTGCEL